MNERTKALIKNAAVLGARALRHYKLARDHEALSTLQQALETTAEALVQLRLELGLDAPLGVVGLLERELTGG